MRNDLITFGKYKNKYWEDIIFSDRSYVEWVSKNSNDLRIKDIAIYWLNEIQEDKDNNIPLKDIVADESITKDSEHYIVKLLGKDDARQLALNIFALTE